MKKISLLVTLLLCYLVTLSLVQAEECDNPGSLTDTQTISGCISKFNGIADAISKANSTNLKELNSLKSQIQNLKTRISNLDNQLTKLTKEVFDREVKVGVKEELLTAKVRRDYIQKRSQSLLLILFSARSANEFFQDLAYREKLARSDREIISSVSGEIAVLSAQKKVLSTQKINLDALKKRVDEQAGFLAREVDKANKYVSDLSGKVAALSARQNEILAARSGSFIVSVGDSELADDYNASIKGFRESAPSGYFGVFSFGAYTHRNGMSQYGALGHVNNQGWNYEQILKHYYPGVNIVDVDTNKTIIVNGTNSYNQTFNNERFNFEDYLKHIYEIPPSWPVNVLKAQAIAARSYAYGKNSICPGQSCQEFKREENTDAWKAAVDATRGKIMTGGPSNWQYSSTTGGWINGLGWDTTDGQGGSNFIDKSFEKIAASPWVYKAWYTETYRNNSDKCGRSNAWLSPQELADIVNAAIALKTGGIDTRRITPISSCWKGNPYSMDELKNLVAGNGGISSASSVSVSQGNGTTNNVTINGISMNGAEFKKAFNLRAPGRLQIPQSGFAFFNIEKK